MSRDGDPDTPDLDRFAPVVARTRSIHHPIAPVAYDCVKLIFVRAGSAILLSEFGEKPVTIGDVVMLGANTVTTQDVGPRLAS